MNTTVSTGTVTGIAGPPHTPPRTDLIDVLGDEVIRLGGAIRDLQEGQARLVADLDERLAAIADLRATLDGAKRGPIKLVHRDANGFVTHVEEFEPAESPGAP